MTERERWVIYPLLFLALGASLRDKLSDRTTTKIFKCQELLVVDEQPLGREVPIARIGRAESTANGAPVGQLLLNGQLGVDGLIEVNGNLNVGGIVNAQQYAYRGLYFAPGTFSIPDALRAYNTLQNQQPLGDAKEKPDQQSPPAKSPPAEEKQKGSDAKSEK